MRVRTKIILITVAVLFMAIGATALVGDYFFTREYSDVLKSKLYVAGQTLKSQLDTLLKLGIPPQELIGFEEQCQDILKKYKEISFAMVVDPNGEILFHNDPGRHGKLITWPETLAGIKNKKEIIQECQEEKRYYYEIILPVLGHNEEHLASIRLGIPQDFITQRVRSLAIRTLGVDAGFLGLAIILLIFALSAWVTNPLAKLTDVIQEIRKKGTDFTGRVEIRSRDEIGQMASAFNQMLDDLQQTTVSKDYLDNILETMIDTLIVVDRERKIKSVNKATGELLGYKEYELIGKPAGMIFKAEEVSLKDADLWKLIEEGHLKDYETCYRAKAGQYIPILFSASVMRDKDGNMVCTVCTGKDITERKRAEEALRESEDRYRDLVEFSQYFIFTHGTEGRILSANQEVANHLEYDQSALLQMNIRDILAPEVGNEFEKYMATIQEFGFAKGVMLVQTRTGEKVLWEYNNNLRKEGVAFPIVRGIAHDITEQKKSEAEREKLILKLQEALSEVKQLSGLLPICSSCKKIRDDKGYWNQIETYIHKHSQVQFSHGICPDCLKKLYPDYDPPQNG